MAPQLRLIDENEGQIGVTSREDALRMARERGLDLVEVSPISTPPVCKIMDYGKYLYRQKKLDQKHKKMQRKAEVKGVRFSMRTSNHDLEIKARQARKFLEERDAVKAQLVFKGREASHEHLAREKMVKFSESLKDISKIDTPPSRHGMSLIMTLVPLQRGGPKPSES